MPRSGPWAGVWVTARIQPLDNETALDPEEERLREAKVQEEARKRDKERMAKETRGPWREGWAF